VNEVEELRDGLFGNLDHGTDKGSAAEWTRSTED
jgi:hypothetical protein